MKVTFEDILNHYLFSLENLRLRKAKGLISDEYFKGAVSYNFNWFEELKHHCDHSELSEFYGVKRKEITPEEKEKYDTEKDFPLIYMLDYRGESVPVYNDDYGQQEFAIYKGETISGGTYNFFPEMEFAFRVDQELENQFLNTPLPEEELKKHTFFSELMEQENEKDEEN